ncbi:MAG TPA: molybdopterin-dependent oxidoreductase [Pirellulaceae bacterium]|nr:molybdopterin-dependent oxidoreductase [Pirellulaceae bacterium]
MKDAMLRIAGLVNHARALSFSELATIDARHQILDVSRIAPGKRGDAVKLAGVLELVQPKPEAKYLSLHATADNFHASIPLDVVKDKAILIYREGGQPLTAKAGGPVRFFIPDHHACHTDEIDECANVKFVDTIELTAEKGFDNRPHDEQEHAELHAKEQR